MKQKIKALDIIIVFAVVIGVALIAVYYFNKNDTFTSGEKTVIEFDVLAVDLTEQQAKSIEQRRGESVIFGKSNVDTGILKNVKTEPYLWLGKDILEEEYIWTPHPSHYQVILTIEKEVIETEDYFKGEKEEIRIGELTPVKGKGFGIADCYVTDIREVSK
jgi:hypothetical protein